MTPLLVALAILHGADEVTTIRNFRAGFSESNPLLPRAPLANLVIKSAEASGTVVALRALAQRKPRLAKTLALAAIVVEGTAVGLNTRAHAVGR